MGRIIALDLGEISLGMAISDSMQIIPTPVDNFMFKRRNLDEAKEILSEQIKKYGDVELILLGYPLRTDGDKSEMTLFVEMFKDMIQDIGPNVKLVDETNSTKYGIEMLSQTIKDKEKIKSMKDVAAAFILLKDYLDMR